MADTVRRLACLMTGQSARALTFAYVQQEANPRRSEGEGQTRDFVLVFTRRGHSADITPRAFPEISEQIETRDDKRSRFRVSFERRVYYNKLFVE